MSTPDQFTKEPDFLVITGSRLYGTERRDETGEVVSDLDLRGFVLPPFDYLAGIRNFREASLDGDHKVYALKAFIEYLLKGNAQMLETLFAPESHQRIVTDLGRRIIDNRDVFLGKQYYKAMTGFSYSEWRKVRGVKLVIEKRKPTEKQVVDDMLNVFGHLDKPTKDEIIELLFSEHEKKEIDSRNQVGKKRAKEYDEFGYGASSASHAIRLLGECLELLEDGKMTFPRPDAKFLRDVKLGKVDFSEVEEAYASTRAKVDEAYEKSDLPDKPNHNKVWDMYREIVFERIQSEVMP
jgi:hypothetical protein